MLSVSISATREKISALLLSRFFFVSFMLLERTPAVLEPLR